MDTNKIDEIRQSMYQGVVKILAKFLISAVEQKCSVIQSELNVDAVKFNFVNEKGTIYIEIPLYAYADIVKEVKTLANLHIGVMQIQNGDFKQNIGGQTISIHAEISLVGSFKLIDPLVGGFEKVTLSLKY
jgi:type II secretory ATPase GspE/PulE/Tfp pilus assembly ATPase PilB-like protein